MFFLGLQDRKESKIGVSVNPDAQNLGKIHVGLIAAKDLIKTDLVGKSSHGNQKFKTNAIKNTQDPEWNYDVDFNVPDGGDNTIKIDIFDEDRFGKDKSLGSAIMDVDEVMARGIVPPGWYPLKGVKSGQVLMSADFDAIGSSRLTSPDRSLIGIDDAKDPLSTTRQKAGGGKELKNRLNSKDQLGVDKEDETQEGMLHIDLLGARNLIKADMIGKADPYGTLKLGDQQFKTDTVKNSQNPEWNYGVDFIIDDSTPPEVLLNIYDHDKLGKDKPLGNVALSVGDLIERSKDPNAGPVWIPLSGVKSGEILVHTNFIPEDQLDMNRRMSGHGKGRQNVGHPDNAGLLKKKDSSRSFQGENQGDIPDGNVHVSLIKAKNLTKSDLIGKSDPYGVISCGNDKSKTKVIKNDQNPEIKADMIGKADPYGTLKLGDQQFKTDTVKNSQNPEWNYGVDFIIDDSTPPEVLLNIYDHDKLGKDKPLGNVALSVGDLIERSKDPNAGPVWIPLSGVKSGEILVHTNFIPEDQLDMNRRMSGHGKGRQNVGHPDNAGLLKKKDSSRSFQGENQGDIPDGNVHVSLIKAKNLTKSDLIGKSDPYGVISCGNDKSKTKVIKNDQNPEFNHEAYFPVNNEGPRNIKIELFDSDKIGSNKPLGSANIDIADIASNGPIIDKWLPLKNSKNGEVMISADFQPKFGDDNEEGRRIPGHLSSHKDGAGGGKGLRDKLKTDSKKPSGSQIEDLIPGNLHLDLLQAKDLIKADMIGKSDPYAVVTASDEKAKTKTVKNSQNPEWNFSMDIPIDVDGSDNIKIDVFDKDKIGKDKPLGSASFNVAELQKGGNLEKEWVPLNGVKTGKLQVSTDFTPGLSDKTEGGQGLPSSNKQRKDSDMSIDEYNPNSRKQSILESGQDSEIPAGNVHLHIHEGKDLSPILQQAMIQSA